jgi:cytochrome c oxidase cbb3-type subunit 3
MPAEKSFFYMNTTDALLLFIAFTLLIPIFYLSKILSLSLKDYIEKILANKSVNNAVIVAIFMAPLALAAQATGAPAADQTSFLEGINFFRGFLLFIILCEVVILAVYSHILYRQFHAHKVSSENSLVEGESNAILRWWNKMNNFGSLQDDEKIDTGHNYDGIRELDNNVPAWFTAIFFATLIFGVVYLWRYHFAQISPLSAEEYLQEEEQADMEYAAYLKNSGSAVDESTLEFLDDKAQIESGKKLYIANCATCHIADGGGAAGPNLADENWIYGCHATEVYKSIKYGRKNGMMAWKDNFSDKQIIELTNYVNSLKGTRPANPKAAQGEICKNEPKAADSSSITTTVPAAKDSALAIK